MPQTGGRPMIAAMGRWGSPLTLREISLLAAALLFALIAAPVAAQTSISEAERATVRIALIAEDPAGPMLAGTGSGFVVAPNLVVTNAHVVAAARQQPNFSVAVVPPEGEGLVPARIVRYSQLNDLALLEFHGGPDVPPATIATLEPRPGDAVATLGYPDVDDLQRPATELVRPTAPSRSSGNVVALRDRAPNGEPIPTINHEAAISSGSSGGPLVDECGRVIGVNTWHTRGMQTLEVRGVATRASQLISFLEEAGVTPRLTDERCLSFAERVEAERVATVSALENQNRELAAKLETADRLTRLALVILICGTLALFIAVIVLGGLLLSRRGRTVVVPNAPVHHEPAVEHPPRRALGVAAVVGGATVAAVIVVAASIWLLRARGAPEAENAPNNFAGDMACAFDASASEGAGEAEDTSFNVSGALCVNGRTLYAPAADGRYQRVILSGGERALDVMTIDPESGQFSRERYPLSESAFDSAAAAAGAASAPSCDAEGARAAVTARNQSLMQFAEGQPSQRLVWRCTPAQPETEN